MLNSSLNGGLLVLARKMMFLQDQQALAISGQIQHKPPQCALPSNPPEGSRRFPRNRSAGPLSCIRAVASGGASFSWGVLERIPDAEMAAHYKIQWDLPAKQHSFKIV